MSVYPTFNNFTIAHQLKRRMRIVVPVLRKDKERCYILDILLQKREGVEQVKLVPTIGSLTIHFDPNILPPNNLLILLDSVIQNLGQQPLSSIDAIKQKNRHAGHPLHDEVFGIGGMSCASCALFLEMVLQRHPDVHQASVNYLSETARLTTYLDHATLFEIIDSHGYQAFAIDTLDQRKLRLHAEEQHLLDSKHHLSWMGVLSVPVVLLATFAGRSRPLLAVQAALTTAVLLTGGRDIFTKAIAQARQGAANMDSLVALGVSAAYGYSLPALIKPSRHVYFEAATAIIDFVLLGRYLEQIARHKAISDIRELVNLQPQQVTRLSDDGKQHQVFVEELLEGDRLLIRPGEKIAVDGEVISGLSSVNEAMITGNSMPSIKEAGQMVFSGCINGSGALEIRITAVGKDTVLLNLLHMVDQAQTSKMALQKTVDRLATFFVPATLLLSAATFGGWVIKGEKIAHALANAIAVMLISCPCALGLATPAATMVGSGRAARRGIYIRNGDALESAATIDTVIFDKTGTITEGRAEVTDWLNVSMLEDNRLLQLAASAESLSEHFLGQALVRHAQQHAIEPLKATRFHNTPDQGIRATVDKHKVFLGNEAWMQKYKFNLDSLHASAKKFATFGNTLVYMAVDEHAVGLFALSDPIRINAAQVISQLHAHHIQTLMVTGDSEAAAHHVAEQLGIAHVVAQADPQKKLQVIRELQQQGHHVAMLGDGINDAPALAAANLSLAIDKGTDIAIESSDLVLLHGDIGKVHDAITLSTQTLGNIKQNLFWAFAYNAVAIPFAVAGRLNPTLASAAMAMSSVSVIANSLRLNRE